MLRKDGSRLFYNVKLRSQRRSLSDILKFGRDSKVCRHFEFAKNLSRL